MDLREYEQVKFRLAELLRSAAALQAQEPSRFQDRARALFARLAEDRFNLVVVGRFSRGKTSLMNAVLGSDRLPTGIRPLTSVITTVSYSSTEKAVIHYAGFSIPLEVRIAELPQYITEQGNSGNRRNVRIAEVQLPAELLRRGFHFVDTPGLGSPIVENTRTTERFLPEADAFVLVTSFEGPLSDEEVRFLHAARAANKAVFVVVNKLDMATPAEREDALHYLREQLRGVLDGEGLGIFPLSARDGLLAKQQRDQALLQASGVTAFETELVRFLIDEKSRVFLSGMCQRVGHLVAELPRSSEVNQLRQRIGEMARQIDGDRASNRSTEAGLTMPVAHHAEPCGICSYVLDRCFEFLRKFQYEITVNPERQQQLAERGGLCSFHIWVYEQLASPQGTCMGYASVLDRWAARLLAAAVPQEVLPGAAPQTVRMQVPGSVACVVCEAQAAAQSVAVDAIAGRLRNSPAAELGTLSEICLPHLRVLVAVMGSSPATARLIAHEAAMLRRMAEDMRRYALKHDGLRRYLASEEETNAAARALLVLAGHRRLNMAPPH